MSALAAPSIRPSMTEPDIQSYPVAANVKCFQGGLAVLAAGKCRPGYTALGLVAVGIFDPSGADSLDGIMDNTGGAADAFNVRVRSGVFRFANSGADPVVAADVGKPCYIVDDNTVAHSNGGGTRSVGGVVVKVESAGVWVKVGSVDGTALAAEITAREALAIDLASSTGTTLAGVLNGTAAKVVADANVIGGIPVVHRVAVADAATGDVDVVLAHKTLITGVQVIKTAGAGGAGDTITVKNGATAITDAMDINVADTTIVWPATMDDAQFTIAAGGTLRVTRTKASANNAACLVVVSGLRVV